MRHILLRRTYTHIQKKQKTKHEKKTKRNERTVGEWRGGRRVHDYDSCPSIIAKAV